MVPQAARVPGLAGLGRGKECSKILLIVHVCRGSRLKRRCPPSEPVQAIWRGPALGSANVGNLPVCGVERGHRGAMGPCVNGPLVSVVIRPGAAVSEAVLRG